VPEASSKADSKSYGPQRILECCDKSVTPGYLHFLPASGISSFPPLLYAQAEPNQEVDPPDSGDSDDDDKMDEGGGSLAAPGGTFFTFGVPGANLSQAGTCAGACATSQPGPAPFTLLTHCAAAAMRNAARTRGASQCSKRCVPSH